MQSLWKQRGFIPYLIIVLLNAMTDLGHKIVLQNTIFKSFDGTTLMLLTAGVNALILLPFILFFLPAGRLSDQYAKPKIIFYASLSAIGLTLLITLAYLQGWFYVAFGLTFILATQSALYSPAKYGLIKELVHKRSLLLANAMVQTVTIVAILLGALLYSFLFEMLLSTPSHLPSEILQSIAPLGILLVLSSTLEALLAYWLMKQTPSSVHHLKKEKELPQKEERTLTLLQRNSTVWLSIVGISIIWGASQLLLTIFGEHLKQTLHVQNTLIHQSLLALSGVGVIVGAILSAKKSPEYLELALLPVGAVGLPLTLLMLPSFEQYFSLGADLFLFGLFAGLFIVPLNTIIQRQTPQAYLGRTLAGSNLIQNLTMVFLLLLTMLFSLLDWSATQLFYLMAIALLFSMVILLKKLPFSPLRGFLYTLISLKYPLHISGLEHLPKKGGVLLLGNHLSFLDWAILQLAYPKPIRFVIDRSYYEKWYLHPLLKQFHLIPISSRGSKGALEAITHALNQGDTVALFPEGHLSRTGHFSRFQRGFERAVEGVEEGVIVPFYLRGLWESPFSYASKRVKKSHHQALSVDFGEPLDMKTSALEIKERLFHLSVKSWETYAKSLPPLAYAWLKRAKKVGTKLSIADSTGLRLSGYRTIVATRLLALSLKPTLQGENIGLLLPTSVGGVLGNLSLLTLGKTVVNLNYSSGEASLRYAISQAEIQTIVTSKKFLQKLKAKGFDLSFLESSASLIYLEEMLQKPSKSTKLFTLLEVYLTPFWWLQRRYLSPVDPSKTTAILFSSGSEGNPKGICLSHTNIMGNIKQAFTLINPQEQEVILGTLPIFHSFGFTVTTMLPLVEGIPLVCHPDPTDGFAIGKLALQYKATMLFATATFLRLYTRNSKLHPLMFQHLRLVVAGAEKLPQEIREAFKQKFGHDIYEGYGATETTPVSAINIPDVMMLDNFKPHIGHQHGSVGLPVPGGAFQIVDPESFEPLGANEEGMVLIGGVHVMQGYLNDPQKTQEVIYERHGIRWYITGDKGRLDEEGFLTIVDRYSRFAKVAGEMVSLGLVEREIGKVLDEQSHIAVVALPDAKKGEKLILLLEGEMSIETLKEHIKTLSLNPLFVPSAYYKVEALPKLGSGKADFKGAKALAKALSQTAHPLS